MITIFTPTYNRGYILERLYESLCRQTRKDFEWVVVDDGSTDNTKQMVDRWRRINRFPIRYIYQENRGKPSAHNLGAENAQGELFTCVDSDDYLVPTAIEDIEECWKVNCGNKSSIIGIVCNRGYDEKNSMTKWRPDVSQEIHLREAYTDGALLGDTMLIYRTDIVRRHCFPYFEGEKFVPESFLYDQIDIEGTLYVLDKVLYIGEYLPDGYTASMKKTNALSPNGYRAYLIQRILLEKESAMKSTGLKSMLFDMIRLISIDIGIPRSAFIDLRELGGWRFLTILLYPAGVYRYFRDFHKFMR